MTRLVGARRLAAVMFTDLVGYTALGQKNESLSLALLVDQRKLIRPILKKHSGREVKTMGDAFLVDFPSALDAVKCARDIQTSAREFNLSLPAERKLHLRIGIHLGDVVESRGDISGDTVNVASRIESLAEDGGVCVTRQVYDQVQNKLDLSMKSIGTHFLKNVSVPLEVYRIEMAWGREQTPASAELDKTRVAVLPFANMSPDPKEEYFADGMTEELIASLSGLKELTVIARTSVMKYKASPKGASEVARELNAGTLIEGSVRKSDSRVRITVQLIDGQTEGHVWAQNYDRQLDDIFAIQTEIAQRVSEELKVQLVESEKSRIGKKPTENTEAYMLYLKGRFYWNERSLEGYRKAIEYYKQSIDRDRAFSLGYSGLALCYNTIGRNEIGNTVLNFRLAKEHALKALELDPNSAEAHVALAGVLTDLEHNHSAAESEYKRAIELKPSYATAHQWYSILLREERRFEKGLSQIREALELDPLSLIVNNTLGDHFYYENKIDSAIEQFRRVIEMDPNFQASHQSIIQPYVRKGMYEAAIAEGKIYSKLSGHKMWQQLVEAYVSAAKGNRKESLSILSDIRAKYKPGDTSPYMMALAHFSARDKEGGFQWLQRAFNAHDAWVHLIAVDFELEGVRSDPRYLRFLNKAGLGHVRFGR